MQKLPASLVSAVPTIIGLVARIPGRWRVAAAVLVVTAAVTVLALSAYYDGLAAWRHVAELALGSALTILAVARKAPEPEPVPDTQRTGVPPTQ